MSLSSSASPPLLDLQGLLAGIRWRRRTWSSLALFGFMASSLMVVLFPPAPAAVVRLLIVHETGQGGTDAIKSDLAILDTTRIAAQAVERLGTGERPEDLLADYTATSLAS